MCGFGGEWGGLVEKIQEPMKEKPVMSIPFSNTEDNYPSMETLPRFVL